LLKLKKKKNDSYERLLEMNTKRDKAKAIKEYIELSIKINKCISESRDHFSI
jgi:hypothetical protein